MRSKPATLILFALFTCVTQAQNRIANGGFEIKENGVPSSKPNELGDVQHNKPLSENPFIEGWRLECLCNEGQNAVTYEDDPDYYCGVQTHSPDWWSTELGNYPLTSGLKFPYQYYGSNPNPAGWTVAYPYEGDKFVGMGRGELISQNHTNVYYALSKKSF